MMNWIRNQSVPIVTIARGNRFSSRVSEIPPNAPDSVSQNDSGTLHRNMLRRFGPTVSAPGDCVSVCLTTGRFAEPQIGHDPVSQNDFISFYIMNLRHLMNSEECRKTETWPSTATKS